MKEEKQEFRTAQRVVRNSCSFYGKIAHVYKVKFVKYGENVHIERKWDCKHLRKKGNVLKSKRSCEVAFP